MEYEYKVTEFNAKVTTSDLRAGTAGGKVSAQLEILLQEHAREGWEIVGQYKFEYSVESGNFLADTALTLMKQNTGIGTYSTYQLVFRKEV